MTIKRRKYLFGLIRVSRHSSESITQAGYIIANIHVLSVTVERHSGWFRIFGKGLKWKKLDVHPKTFSERNGFSKYIVINNWLIGYLS